VITPQQGEGVSMTRKFSRVIVSTDIPGFLRYLGLNRIPYCTWGMQGEDFQSREIDPENLYVFAYRNPAEAVLTFLASKVTEENVLVFFRRPGSGFTSSDERLKNITMISGDTLLQRVQQEVAKVFS